MILDNRRITIREVTYDVGVSFGSCQAIFMEVFGMKHAAAKSDGHRSGNVDDVQRRSR